MPNLNYPDYSQGFGGYGSYVPMASGGATPNPAPTNFAADIMPYAALTGALTGTALSAYGAYQQGKQADREYRQQVKAWEAEQERQRRLDEENRRQQTRQNALSSGQYAQNLEQDAYGTYSPYARRMGL